MKLLSLSRSVCLTVAVFSAPVVLADEPVDNETAVKEVSETSSAELTALQKDVQEGEQILAETQAEIESLKNQLMNSQEERKKYDEDVKRLMKKLEEVQ